MATIRNLDPATGELLAEIPITTPTDLDAAVARARAAQLAWAETPPEERFARLARAGEKLAERKGQLGELVTYEMGKTKRSAVGEVQGYATGIPRMLAEVAEAIEPQSFEGTASDTVLVRDPHGVVAAITPWNFPFGMPLEILIPALATGNTVVFKPSELVPQTGAALAEILADELPAGVLETVQGAGDVGARLVAADVDMVGFVGSRETGMKIMESASRGLKRLVLELGGKDPMIVFADADLDAAAESAVQHSLRNTGQVCCSVERVYVADTVADDFEKLVVSKAREWKHGNGFQDGVKMGPMVSEEQRGKVAAQVDEAVRDGARLLLGGEPDGRPGYFYPATVLADVEASQRISYEETFGPVVSLTTFSGSEEEGVRLANDTPYGLGANVWTGDAELGRRVARRIRAGQVGVNRYLTGASGTPWVGARQSGFGFLGGVEGHRQFTTPKSIAVAKA
ncbi:MAG: aldehyde dehydrogenase [bacterium]|nr:aldehyde dehydrogenase [bacterium]